MVVDLVRLTGLLRMPSFILKVCELSRSITCRLFMLKRYFNRKGPTTADAMMINVHPFWVHAFDLFIICHLLNVYHMMVLIFQQYAFHLAFQSSPRHSIDGDDLHPHTPNALVHPPGLLWTIRHHGPSPVLKWDCLMSTAASQRAYSYWSTIQEFHNDIAEKRFDSLWWSFGFNLVYVFHVVFLVYIVILQCSTRLSLPSKLIRTGVVFNVWGRFGGCWKGVAHHLEHQVHEFLFASTSSDMTGI